MFDVDRVRVIHLGGSLREFAQAALGESSPLLLGRAASAALTLWLPLVLVRLLSPEAFGGYKQFFLVAQSVLLVGQVGLTQSLYFFLPRGGAGRGAYLVQAAGAMAVLGLALGGALYLAAPALEVWLSSPVLLAARAPLAFWIVAMLASAPLEIGLVGEQRLVGAAAATVLFDGLRSAALIGSALFLEPDALFWSAAGVAWLRVVALLALLLRRVLPVARPSRLAWKAQLAFALPFAGSGLLAVGQRYFSQYAVSAYFGPVTLALFTVASFHLFFVDIVFIPISDVLTVRLSRAIGTASGVGPRGRSPAPPVVEWDQAVHRLALAFFPLTCCSVAFAPKIVPLLFTDAYRDAVPLFVLVSLQIPLFVLPGDAVLWAAGRARLLLVVNTARALVTVVAVIAGIALLGLPGAILGALLSDLLARLAVLARGSATLGLSLSRVLHWATLARIAAAAIGAAPPAWGASQLLPDRASSLALGLATYAACYLGLLLVVGLPGHLVRTE